MVLKPLVWSFLPWRDVIINEGVMLSIFRGKRLLTVIQRMGFKTSHYSSMPVIGDSLIAIIISWAGRNECMLRVKERYFKSLW